MHTASLRTLPLFCCFVLLSGCAMQQPATSTLQAAGMRGSVYGGQQPVASSAVYLYAATYGSTATPSVSLLKASSGTAPDGNGNYYALTDANGNFNLAPGGTPAYSCTAGQQLYVISVGGNAGLGNNASLILAAALGDCSTVSTSTFINMNELTTVAAAYALNNITVTPTEISACAGQTSCSVSFATAAMAVAFANVNNLVSLALGSALSTTPTGGGVVPASTLNTLGDIIATCVNSSGTVSANGLNGGPTPCYSLFSNAKTTAGVMPTDTFTAALNIARNPTANVANLFQLPVGVGAPFQPELSAAPTDWTVTVAYPTSLQFTQ